MMEAVSVQNLCKSYGEKQVLKNLTDRRETPVLCQAKLGF